MMPISCLAKKFRFSIATALICMAIVAAAFAFIAHERMLFNEEKVTSQVLASSSYADFYSARKDREAPAWCWAELSNGRLFIPVDTVEISVDSSDHQLNRLHSFRHLKNLRLKFTNKEPMTVDFSNLSELTDLKISASSIANDSVISVAKLQQLRSLSLRKCRIDNDQLHLCSQLNLHRLNLSGNPFLDDQGLVSLHEMPELKSLILNDTSVCGEIGFPRCVEELSLNGTLFNDEACASMCGSLLGLKSLSAKRTAVTDRAIESILSLPKLELLRVSGTSITEEGLSKLTRSRFTVF